MIFNIKLRGMPNKSAATVAYNLEFCEQDRTIMQDDY